MVMFEVTPTEVEKIEAEFRKNNIPVAFLFPQTVSGKQFLSVCGPMPKEKRKQAEKILSRIALGLPEKCCPAQV